MVVLATEHARTRHQFGRPIGAFQAVQHQLADACAAIRAAELAAAEAHAAGSAFSALMAKIWAGRAAVVARANSQQVLGGTGFTWEHDLHRYVRRSLVLSALLGDRSELRAELAACLAAPDTADYSSIGLLAVH
jgi:alkylation response protein AidB-like acyl-CoA dehydrogenase